jgi:hypothetical protein
VRLYDKSVAGSDHCLKQGEFISNLLQVTAAIPTISETGIKVDLKTHPLAVILSQGCDLEQDFKARNDAANANKTIPAVLFCEVISAAELRSKVDKSATLWTHIRTNIEPRYHFFQKVDKEFDAEGQGLDELGVDFKRYFTIPTDEIYYRIGHGEAKRRCQLVSPYAEHFCQRFAQFFSRIALPEPHTSV